MLLSLVGGRASLCQAARAAATSPRRSATRVERRRRNFTDSPRPRRPPRNRLYDNLCALDKNVAQDIDTTLYKYWKDGYGPLPVLIMKNTKVNGEYQKETFVQSFTFASGNCIKDYGSKTLHYVGDGQGCS